MTVQPPPESTFSVRNLLGPGSIIGILVGIVGPFIYSFLSERQLEISFDKLDYVSTSMLGNLIGLDVQRKPATLFKAYFGEDFEGATKISTGDVKLSRFYFSHKIKGSLTLADNTVFSLIGFHNDDRLVFSHRGPVSGVGSYVLRRFQSNDTFFMGHAIVEDLNKAGVTRVLQCPFVMFDPDVAARKYPNPNRIKEAFPFMGTSCIEFKSAKP